MTGGLLRIAKALRQGDGQGIDLLFWDDGTGWLRADPAGLVIVIVSNVVPGWSGVPMARNQSAPWRAIRPLAGPRSLIGPTRLLNVRIEGAAGAKPFSA